MMTRKDVDQRFSLEMCNPSKLKTAKHSRANPIISTAIPLITCRPCFYTRPVIYLTVNSQRGNEI